MRADRLLSLLMLLQTRGKMTALELAEALEVSERTIYRDIEALSASGVPVYGDPGRNGGFDLLERYRTDLTGLNESELQALWMLSIPAPLVDLGVSQDLQAALLKISAALPASQRQHPARVRQRFHLDSNWWQQGQEPVPHLRTIEKAVWQDQRLLIHYRPFFLTQIEQVVDPYGLVAKAGVWYLVYAQHGSPRAQRVSSLREVCLLDESFVRPQDFDLVSFWKGWCIERERLHANYIVQVRVAAHFVPELPMHFGERIQVQMNAACPQEPDGAITLQLAYENLHAARAHLLGLGNGVEVLEPLALRLSLQDYARQVLSVYSEGR